jgi:hypothetical protein
MLTEKQIRDGNKWLDAHLYSELSVDDMNEFADIIRQPIEPPTDEEVLKVSGGSYKDVLNRFVKLRNAPPAPVDKRRETIILAYLATCVRRNKYRRITGAAEEYADAILAALDAAEGKKETKC